MRVGLGQGIAQTALQTDAQQPGRWSAQERAQIYQRVFGAPGGTSEEVKPNREFADLFLRFVSSVAQFGRLPPLKSTTPALSTEWLRTAARELAAKISPQVDSASAARDSWQVIDEVGTLELGGAANSMRHRTMAQSGGAILEWLARHGDGADTTSGVDDGLLQAVEQWLAVTGTRDDDVQALSQPEATQRVAAWSQSLRQAVGLSDDAGARLVERAPKTAVLFSGPSGTGKTLAAHWLATSLGTEVYRIDLSQVISKYIGETEKNLDAVFARAEQSRAVLLFDEADALFGKRSDVHDSHDRYANQDVNYLLQRIENYDGMTILASNAKSEIDPDVLKRLQAVVVFPPPPR
ncbi:MAG TPA: ATP-binding protein [Burkholderiaceae bacterium]|nr:ATP-binding protein [Burkholderiaceae bacterium]